MGKCLEYIYIYIYNARPGVRTVQDGDNPSRMAVATSSIMNIMNIKLKLLVIESRIKHL